MSTPGKSEQAAVQSNVCIIEILTFTALQIKTGPPSLIALGRRIGLVSHKKLHGFHPDYTLTIVCNITVYEQIKVTSSGNDCFKICDQISEEQYHEDIGRLFVNGDFTDFRVHRAILAGRSPVFNAMFSNDMDEKREAKVNKTCQTLSFRGKIWNCNCTSKKRAFFRMWKFKLFLHLSSISHHKTSLNVQMYPTSSSISSRMYLKLTTNGKTDIEVGLQKRF